MPRLTKRRSDRKHAWTDGHIRDVLNGMGFTFRMKGVGGGVPTRQRDPKLFDDPHLTAKQQCWDDLQDELLPAWIAEKPFTRPWAWWAFDAPARRERLDGLHPFDNPTWRQSIPQWLSWGQPRFTAVVEGDNQATYETEQAYLTRLDLLTDYERAMLTESQPGEGAVADAALPRRT